MIVWMTEILRDFIYQNRNYCSIAYIESGRIYIVNVVCRWVVAHLALTPFL